MSTAIGVLGITGYTAYFGLELAAPKPGDRLLVSGAVGGVGSSVGQIARIRGCTPIVAVCGGAEKARLATQRLGYDHAIDYRNDDIAERLNDLFADGVDVYFDNVGSWISDAVYPLVNVRARIAICGMIAEYNLERPEVGPRLTRHILVNRAKVQGLIVLDWAKRYGEGLAQMAAWLREGKLKYREDVVDGLENAPRALLRLFRGENFGKQLVRLRPDPTRR
jgi:hypothetical protein